MTKGWQVVGAFIVVFLAGAAFGVVFTLRYAVDHLPAIVDQQHKGGEPPKVVVPQQFNVQMLRNWINARKLDLTPVQRRQIQPILNDTLEDVQRLSRENQHSAVLILEHMQDEVEQILTPEQRIRFDELRQQQRQRFFRFQQEQQERRRQLQRDLQEERQGAMAPAAEPGQVG